MVQETAHLQGAVRSLESHRECLQMPRHPRRDLCQRRMQNRPKLTGQEERARPAVLGQGIDCHIRDHLVLIQRSIRHRLAHIGNVR